MSGMYTKLFGSIVHSTIWREADSVRLVWITMLALSDKKGCVWASIPGLADAARVSVEECRQAIDKLSSPDPDSRTQVEEGRRIIAIDGGWWLINHAKFQKIKNMDERREQVRLAVQKHRSKKEDVISVINVSSGNPEKSGNPPVSPSDQTRPTKTTTSPRKKPRGVKSPPTWLTPFRDVWESIAKPGTFASIAGQAAAALAPLIAAGNTPEGIAEQLGHYLEATEPKYWSITKFAQTFGQWEEPPPIVGEGGWFTAYGERMMRTDA